MSRGPGTWQREIMRTVSGAHTVTVGSIVRCKLPEPTRSAHVAARQAAKDLAIARRVTACYAYSCGRCGQIQDHPPEECCGAVRAHLAVSRPGRTLRCPAPPPGGRAPSWISLAPAVRPPGQLATPTAADLSALVLRRLWERLDAGEINVSIADAVSVHRLAHDIEHDQALIERDQACIERDETLLQAEDLLWAIRSSITRQYGPDAWPAIAREVRKQIPSAAGVLPGGTAVCRSLVTSSGHSLTRQPGDGVITVPEPR